MIFKNHYCELRTDKLYKRLRPGASFRERINLRYFHLVAANYDFAFTRSMFRSNFALKQEIRRHYRSKYWYVIHPCSKFAHYFSWTSFFLIILDLSMKPMTAYFTGFDPDKHRIQRTAAVVFDVIMLIYCLINFFCGYILPNTNEVILDGRAIVKRYLRTFFFFDLFASLSFNIYYVDEHTDNDLLKHFTRSLCLLRSARLVTIINKFRDAFKLNNRIEYALLPFVIQLVTYQLHVLTLIHYYIVHELYVKHVIIDRGAWIMTITGKKMLPIRKYLTTSWVTAKLFYRLGNLIYATNDWEHLISTIVMLMGTMTALIVTSILLRIFQLSGITEMKYQAMFNELNDYSLRKELPIPLKKKLLLFYERKFDGRYLIEERVLESLTQSIKDQVFHYDCLKQTKEITLLKNLPQDIIYNLWYRTTQELYLENDVLFKLNEDIEAIYMISSGSIALIMENGVEYERHLRDGDVLGEMSYVYNKKALYAAIAVEVTAVLRLSVGDLEELFVESREFKEAFMTSAAWKLKKTRTIDDLTNNDKRFIERKTVRKYN